VNFVELATAAKAGDEEAFYTLMSLQKERLYRIAYAYLKNEDDAIEAIQEATYRAWKTIRRLREERLFPTWIVRILLNCCNDEWKRKRRFPAWKPTRLPAGGGGTAGMASASAARGETGGAARPAGNRGEPTEAPEACWALRLQVSDALSRLEPKYRQLIVLKYYEDMTLAEIAETLEQPLGTVKARLHYALRAMRLLMNEEDER